MDAADQALFDRLQAARDAVAEELPDNSFTLRKVVDLGLALSDVILWASKVSSADRDTAAASILRAAIPLKEG